MFTHWKNHNGSSVRDAHFITSSLSVALGSAAKGLLSVFIITSIGACSGSQSFDRGVTDKATEYHSDLTAEQQAEARRVIGSKFSMGLKQYRLNTGDVVEVLFMFNSDSIEIEEYRIHIGDLISLEFFQQPEMSRKLRVRPDGRVTLPREGDVMAAGKTPSQLTQTVKNIFSREFRDPQITISVEELTSATSALADALEGFNIEGGRSRKLQIAPDGYIYPPFVPPVKAAGKTLEEVRTSLDVAYTEKYQNLAVSLQLSELTGNRVFVFGEVRTPGAYPLQGPQTVLQAVAMAGGWLPTAAKRNVRVVYWDEKLEARVRAVDVESVASDGLVSQDMILSSNSTIYVPPSAITSADRFVDQYIRQLFLFNGTSLNVTYEQNFPSN